MQFNSGSPSLVGYTRFLVNDPTTAPSQQWSTQEVKDSVNLAYFNILARLKSFNPGLFLKVGNITTVKDQTFYNFPSDFQRMKRVEVSYDGVDMSTTEDLEAEVLDYVDLDLLLDHKQAESSGVFLWAPRHTDFAIYPAVETAGTNSMELTYEFDPAQLSADTSSPVIIPPESHKLISLMAARDLKLSRDFNTVSLDREIALFTDSLLSHFHQRQLTTSQFQSAAFEDEYVTTTKQGRSA